MLHNPERIEYLLRAYSGGTATPQEEQELLHWAIQATDARPFNDHIQSLINQAPETPAQVDWESLYSRIQQQKEIKPTVPTPVHRIHFLRHRSWWVAAGIAVLLTAGAYTWLTLNTGEKPPAVAQTSLKNDVAPGGNKALLTLADGSVIALDNAANGTLASQGATHIVKQEDGKLAYNTGGSTPAAIAYNTLTTPMGGQYQLTLPDGTRVWLNAGSSLRYPTAFAGDERRVTLTGEAYFEVAPRNKQPFRVSVDGLLVNVLGTSFNLNAYGDEASIKTTLIDGLVAVQKGDRQQQVSPGQKAVYDKSSGALEVEPANIEADIAWKNGLFFFKGSEVSYIMRQISRWYQVDVHYDNDFTGKTLSGKIRRDANLSEVLDMLQYTGIHCTLNNNTITVTK